MVEYDAIVVGARCAGSPTAMLLARKGYKVLLVDKASFPSDTISTHIVWPTGASRLRRWGLLNRVIASGCPTVNRPMSFDFGPVVLSGSCTPYDGQREAYAPRRTVLDTILVEAAAEARAEVRERFSVDEVTRDDGRVTGIRGHGRQGGDVLERARIVIGADGLHSVVAKAVGAPTYNEKPVLGCYYYSYWSGVKADGVEFHIRPHRASGCIPTNDGLMLVLTAWPAGEFREFRWDVEGNYMKTLDLVPEFADRVRDGKREERIVGTGDVPNFFRKPYGPGWALVGDAGYHKDPSTAQGISDAFRDAEALTDAIDAGFSGRAPLEEALAGYERRRNEEVLPLYDLTCELATLEPPPEEMQRLFGALEGNQEQIDRFCGVIAGTVPVPEFFAPENVARINGGRPSSAEQAPHYSTDEVAAGRREIDERSEADTGASHARVRSEGC